MGIRNINRTVSSSAGRSPLIGSPYIFLDDMRKPPAGYAITDDVETVLIELASGNVRGISLDHDLGEGLPTGYDLIKRMIEEDVWPTDYIYIHSSNPVGVENMYETLMRYAPDHLIIKKIDYLTFKFGESI